MAEMTYSALAELGANGPDVAAKAVYVATFARQYLGHNVNMFTEKAWRTLKEAATSAGGFTKGIRCTECGAIGTLDEWTLMLSGCCGQWERYRETLEPGHGERLKQMERQCTHIDTRLGIDTISLLLEG